LLPNIFGFYRYFVRQQLPKEHSEKAPITISGIVDILKEERARLESLITLYEAKIAELPAGKLVEKQRSGKPYAYRVHRSGDKVVWHYVGRIPSDKVAAIEAEIAERKRLEERRNKATE
jgi:hypothetical protein